MEIDNNEIVYNEINYGASTSTYGSNIVIETPMDADGKSPIYTTIT